jgi:MerR family transcriptional regulator, copper efflux regulator
MPATLTIGQLAKLGQVNLETIRFYEREGLLPEPPRSRSGYRAFPEGAVRQLRFIKRAQELGFSLAEIRQLLALKAEPNGDCAKVCRQAREKLLEVDQKIHHLQAMKRGLQRLTRACSGNRRMSECGILENLDREEARW